MNAGLKTVKMKHNPRYPIKHLSIRVPWHDNAWNGSICNNPKANGACLALKNCALNRDDDKEERLAGKSLNELDEEDYPVCISERGTFMSDFNIPKTLKHPYIELSPKTHGHLKPTNVIFPKYSGAAVPYNWMLKDNASEKASLYDLGFDDNREPTLAWGSGNDNWVQEITNQKSLLDCFFEHVKEETSLVFFYAKQVPFVESSGRVIIGVGKVNKIIPSEAYEGSNNRFGAAYWEHMVLHTIRNDNKNGFLLPYHDALEYQEEHPDFDPSTIAVLAPNDKHFEFSYATEHVGTDTSIRVLLECLNSLNKAQELGFGKNIEKAIQWIHDELSKLEKLRGFYPGMGAALCSFGIAKGHFVAASIINNLNDDKEDPWLKFEEIVEGNSDTIRPEIDKLIPENSKKLYSLLKEENGGKRIDLLHLLSRFDLSIEQATSIYVHEEREKIGISRKDEAYIENPYLIYEDLRFTKHPISIQSIDLGMYLKNIPDNLRPGKSFHDDPLHSHRIRALTIYELEKAVNAGHTLLPRKNIVNQIRELPLDPKCPVNSDYYIIVEESFDNDILKVEMKNGNAAYQLQRFGKCKQIISNKVNDRIKAKRLTVDADWENIVDETLRLFTEGIPDEQEKLARTEKSAALGEIAESRFSVLIGPAGTGKTTVLNMLASHSDIEGNGVLLLAPTGKARVRMEVGKKSNLITAKTLAEFLNQYSRYNGELQQYKFSDRYCEGQYETVILDEASMLTEVMLATTLDCLKGVKRFILVGDHRQLPPIGAGRPFLDIINHLKKDSLESQFPRVSNGYVELTIKRRQGGSNREDLQLAEWFSGEPLEPAADEVINKILYGLQSDYLRLESWDNENDFNDVLEKVLADELGMQGSEDVESFNLKLGSKDGRYFNFREAVEKCEDWQILSPVREKSFGVRSINRTIHKQFRQDKINYANSKHGKIPKPLGLEEIVYGDKVINLQNSRRDAWPKNGIDYVANGEIGMVIGQFKRRGAKFKGKPKYTEVEFASQKGYKYTYKAWDFKEEGDVPLELAYALTVHKSQGSEFDKVFLIVPNPCFLLTREMLYTALTRQTSRVIVLHQGSIFDIKELASPLKSETLKRITNLFKKPELVEIDGHYLEKNLIHQASDGKMLRSKSELLIYQRLLDRDLRPLYENPLTIKEVKKLPDFTIENDDTGELYYWEHCGMMHVPEYKDRWNEKYNWYLENDILPYDQGGGEKGTLIVTEDKPHVVEDGSIRGAISVQEIDDLISKVFG
jgi:ATP-dependent exoDNAse (exonuclease V) alpha subunit